MRLYSYFRSSAAYRIRIALALKGLAYDIHPVNLVASEQRAAPYREINPQGLVPAVALDDGTTISQSMAILEWLEETYPQPPLYDADAIVRAQQRALCQHIACDIHPLNNLRVLHYLRDDLALDEDAVSTWYAHWVREGFNAMESAVARMPSPFSLGDEPGMVEVLLVPQMYNARRFSVDLQAYPSLRALDARCAEIEAFIAAHPSRQPDTPEALRSPS